jgi:hypothetical protein
VGGRDLIDPDPGGPSERPMDGMTDGDPPHRATARRGLRVEHLLLLLPLALVLSLGCRTPTRLLDPEVREPDPNPLARVRREDDRDPPPPVRDGGEGQDDPGAGDDEPETWPNVESPGPDMANFPNSAFTIPRGAFQVEFAPVTLSGPTINNGPNYNTQFLLRYGLTDRLEFRLFGIGFDAIFNSPQRTTGFAPPAFDLKMNLWGESKNHLIPATGLEVYLQSTFGSPVFRSGLQPAMSLLFDHTLPLGFQFEWNIGFNGAQRPVKPGAKASGPINVFHGPEENTLELNLQWALQRRLFGKVDVFTHGFLNSSAIPSLGDGVVVGAGGLYAVSRRVSLFGSYNAGLTRDAPTTFLLLGFASAF